MIKKIVKYGIVFAMLIFIFNFLLFISSLFSSELIEKNVRESSSILSQEGNRYRIFKYSDVKNNNYTDSIMINEAYSIDNKNPIYSYMTARKNYKDGLTKNFMKDTAKELISINSPEVYDPVGELEEFLNGKIDTSVNYARYWHGYLPILRVLLIFFNIAEIRKILLIVFIIFFVWLIGLVKNKIGVVISIILALSLIIEGYFFVSYSLESAPVFLVMMISSIILLKRIDKIRNLYLYFFIISCITNFVDYLTVPLITLAIPLLIYILYEQKNNSRLNYKDYLILILKSSVVWFIGYAVTWLSKWIIYDIMYGEGLVRNAISQVIYRSESYNANVEMNIINMIMIAIFSNLEYAMWLFSIGIFIMFIMSKKYTFKLQKKSIYINENVPMVIISIMPLVWYAVLGNHTLMHYVFVYRHMLIFLIAVLICLKNIFVITKKEGK